MVELHVRRITAFQARSWLVTTPHSLVTSMAASDKDSLAVFKQQGACHVTSNVLAGPQGRACQLRPGLQAVHDRLSQLLSSTIHNGDNCSLLVVGAPGVGKTLVSTGQWHQPCQQKQRSPPLAAAAPAVDRLAALLPHHDPWAPHASTTHPTSEPCTVTQHIRSSLATPCHLQLVACSWRGSST